MTATLNHSHYINTNTTTLLIISVVHWTSFALSCQEVYGIGAIFVMFIEPSHL